MATETTERRFRLAINEYQRMTNPSGKGVKGNVPFGAADLVRFEFMEVPALAREGNRLEAEFYCPNEKCAMREVSVSVKTERQTPPPLRCPACGEELVFHH